MCYVKHHTCAVGGAAAMLAERTLTTLTAAEFLVREASQVAIIAFG